MAPHLTKFQHNSIGQNLDKPMAGAARFGLVAALLVQYYGSGSKAQDLREPLRTVVAKARHGLVTVSIKGEDYVIADIAMRMLEPHELAAAQGFPADYQLIGTKAQKTARIGNSVCSQVAEAIVRAQFATEIAAKAKGRRTA
jgi:DNA (cytosine-5)-methyltransferase 1